MNKICFFGGNDLNWVYDPIKDSWDQLLSMNIERYKSSCTVFQGQCVVLGGKNFENKVFKTVESYDHYLKNGHSYQICKLLDTKLEL